MYNEDSIVNLLKEKSATKQIVYSKTKDVFNKLVLALNNKEKSIASVLKDQVKNVELEFKSNGEFDAQLKFAGDTLLFHMHSNIFDFPPNHHILNSKYVKEDNLRSFCGVINIYNFLSDSLKYNRLNDEGFLVQIKAKNRIIGYSLFFYNQITCKYFASCILTEYFKIYRNLQHLALWFAIKYSKSICKNFYIGLVIEECITGISEKEINIGKFKSKFNKIPEKSIVLKL